MNDARVHFDAAAEALYAVSLRSFTAERKRLASELRKAGDRAGAVEFGKLARPTMSAWVVNQLWRQARTHVDAVFAAADRIRAGQLEAVGDQRAALARLRACAADLLRGDGHASSEQTLVRTTTTLQALAAAGSFHPDRPGRLSTDRDPPGFEAMTGFALPKAAEPLDAGGLGAWPPANSQLLAPAAAQSGARTAAGVAGAAPHDAHVEGDERGTRLKTMHPEPAGSDASRAGAAGVEGGRSEPARAAAGRAAPAGATTDATRTLAERADTARAQATRAEIERAETARVQAARVEAERIEAERAAAVQAQRRKQRQAEVETARRALERARRDLEGRATALEQQRTLLRRAELGHDEARARFDAAERASAEAQARLAELD